jgi:hypothetical protein
LAVAGLTWLERQDVIWNVLMYDLATLDMQNALLVGVEIGQTSQAY